MATKEVNSKEEVWIAQCKAYSDLVGPEVIRDLIGTRNTSLDCKLLLATTEE